MEIVNKSFVFGVAVSDYNFTGRKEEIRQLETNFKYGINTILISPRRWGKTSLVKHVCNHLNDDNVITVVLDIFGCKTEYEFYNALASAVLQQTATKPQYWFEEAKDFLSRLVPSISISPEPNSSFSISLGITPKTHSPEEVLNLVETIAKKRQRRIVVCIDEFQQIGEFQDSRSIQARLRSVWQHQELTSYCLFGSKKHLMSSIFLDKSMPFYQFGMLMWLNKIPTADWSSYIIEHFNNGNRSISLDIADSISTSVEGYSSYVQQLAWILYTHTREGESATKELLDLSLEELIQTNEILFMQQIEPLSAYQMNLLKAISAGHHNGFSEKKLRSEYDLGSPANIVRIRKALIERDLIYQEQSCLMITDPVFKLWFRKKWR